LSFAICGLSINGLINTHLIAYCGDHGIPAVNSATMLAIIGGFSLIGLAASAWSCDRFNPRFLLFWYLRTTGAFTRADSLHVFSLIDGLDWVATGPPTVALTNQVFGRNDAPVIVAWIFAGHQVGGDIAALGAGFVRSATVDYPLALLISGLACLLASLLVLRIARPRPSVVAAD
jgi:sugar phosphate permease